MKFFLLQMFQRLRADEDGVRGLEADGSRATASDDGGTIQERDYTFKKLRGKENFTCYTYSKERSL